MFRIPFISNTGLVVSEHPLASVVGAKVLSSGGNAVDAAVATSFALSVLQPQLSGLGGDYFALIYIASEGKVYFINGSGYSPRSLNPDFLRSLGLKEIPPHTPYSITIPGMVDALHNMWSRFGSIEWGELVSPSVKLAEEGFPQYPSLVKAVRENYELLAKDEGSKNTYLIHDIGVGKWVKFPNLGKALKLISEDYRNFYEGDIAEFIVNYLRSKGGFIELDDFKDYKSFWGESLRIDYRGYQVLETPPNTQGVTTLHILKLLSNINLSSIKLLSSEEVKLLLKCFRAAYRIRDKYVGDPRYVTKDLVGPEVINELLTEFEDTSANVVQRRNTTLGDTTYYVVVDKEGNVVSGIQSIFYSFGSGITEPKYGITLNCRGSSFTLTRGDVNELAPRKYPLHTLSTTLVLDPKGSLKWVLGTSGGHYRPQIHVELITSLIDYGLDVQRAVELPRFLWDLSTDELIVEGGVDVVGVNEVKIRKVNYPSRLGVAAIVEFLGNVKIGASDVRGDGLALSIEYP